MKKGRYAARTFNNLKNVFRTGWKKLATITMLDLGFYILAFLILLLSQNYLLKIGAPLDSMDPNAVADMDDSAIESATSIVDSFNSTMIAMTTASLIAVFLLFSASAYLIWMAVSEKKKSGRGFLKSIILSAGLIFLFFILSFLYFAETGLLVGEDGTVMAGNGYAVLIYAFTLVSAFAYALFARTNRIVSTIKEAFALAKKTHLLLIPIIIIVVSATLLLFIVSLPARLGFANPIIGGIALIILFIYAAYARNYVYIMIEDALKREKK